MLVGTRFRFIVGLLLYVETTMSFMPVKKHILTSSGTCRYRKFSIHASALQPENLPVKDPTSSVLSKATNLFPVWVAGASIIGLLKPATLSWFSGSYIELALGATMVMMGSTLSLEDFKGVNPSAIALGFIAQFTIMPMMAVAAARLFQLPPVFSAGLILVGCCPGGTASNLVTLIAQADVALSVAMTSCSTIMAAVMTPLLASWLAGAVVPLSGSALVVTTLKVVLAPVALGMSLRSLSPKAISKLQTIAPITCVALVALICGGIVAQNAGLLLGAVGGGGTFSLLSLVAAVATMHSGGFALGYASARVSGLNVPICRTVAIETGMQNSALATVLALRAFAAGSATSVACIAGVPASAIALPGAVSATVHSILGSTLACLWRRSDERKLDASKQ